MRILIGYDGSVSVERALFDLSRAGLPVRTEAVVLSVTTAWGKDPVPQRSRKPVGPGSALKRDYQRHLERALKDAQTTAEHGRRYLRDHFRTWDIKADAAVNDAAEAILRKAETWNADLIVVGSAQSAISRFFLGSVSQKVLHHANTNLRITRAGLKEKPRHPRILIGLDGSLDSLAAVAEVCSRSWPEKSVVKLVAVIDTRSPLAIFPARTAPRGERRTSAIGEQDWLERKMEAAVDQLAAVGLKAKPVILRGDPRRVLLEQAKDWHAHGIFLGSRGLNRVERFIIGSISSTVAAHAPCSVEVIKRRKKGSVPGEAG